MIYFNKKTRKIVDKPGRDVEEFAPELYNVLPTDENIAKKWQIQEMKWISEEIEKKADSHKTASKSSMADLRKYRNAVRDYFVDGVINGEKPERPE